MHGRVGMRLPFLHARTRCQAAALTQSRCAGRCRGGPRCRGAMACPGARVSWAVLVLVAGVAWAHPARAVDRVALFTEWGTDANAPPGRAAAYVDPILFAARGPLYSVLDV